MKQEDEKLSMLLDDQVDADAAEVLDEVVADVNLQYRLRRYQMIGEVMRNELPPAIDTGFHQNVMAKIRAEAGAAAPSMDSPSGRAESIPLAARSWFRPLAGLAVAASVAVVTVALWQPLQQQEGAAETLASGEDQQTVDKLAGQPVSRAVTVSTRVQHDGTHWITENESPVLQQKLNAYLVNHTEYSNSMQGLIPQARVAGFDAQE